MKLDYDPALPITAHRAEIVQAILDHRVIVVCGATGSGKTTQLPKLCLEAGRATTGLIGHTQPRRIAARALAHRLGQELGAGRSGLVGYQVRFHDRTGPNTRIKLMTDGILLKELESDRRLDRYDTLIIDEVHERTLNIDLLLGVLRQLSVERSELRVIITSATLDPERLSQFFAGAPIIEVSGRGYPVEVRYRPLWVEPETREPHEVIELALSEGIVAAVRELDDKTAPRGDTLVFLPGEKQIREAARGLREAHLHDTEILPLFARLTVQEQERIFTAHAQRRIVLATNVAETSLTVPGVRCVIDSGLARISRYSTRAKVQRLPIERISKASAEQRKGRCGREAPGICIRLFSEEDFARREEFTPPEVLRTNLASVILRMAALELGQPENFPFLDPPDVRLINDGVRLLQELQAMDSDRRVTRLGRSIAALPVDPRLGRMLLAASQQRCLTEMLVIAAFLEIPDPRERPTDQPQQAAEKHAVFADARSDFVTVVNLWRAFDEQVRELSGSRLRRWCRERFLSFVRMREWQELHAQLLLSMRSLRLPRNTEPAGYAALHKALLSGFLGSIGHLDANREYQGPRGVRFVIAPGTPLAGKPPSWIVAGYLLQTTRVYARMVAAVEPGWIEIAAAHLVKRTYAEAQWVRSRGFAAALETVSLYGLILASARRVNYGAIAPQEARALFIQEALVAGRSSIRGGFMEANRRLRLEIEALEAKIRRRDLLATEVEQADFFAARVPQGISSVAAFEHWRARAERKEPRLLQMSRGDLLRRDPIDAGPERFPDEWAVGPHLLPLQYRFEPGGADDGVTLVVPEPLVHLLEADELAWLVPGWRLELVTAIFRALPKAMRKLLVPVPEHARRALEDISATPRSGFLTSLAYWITRESGSPVAEAALAELKLPEHLRMNIRVVDANDGTVAEGRDLAKIKHRMRIASASGSRPPSTREPVLRGVPVQPGTLSSLHRKWDFGELPERCGVERNRLQLTVYPALEDRHTGVAIIEVQSRSEAETISRGGMVRLTLLILAQQAKDVARRIAEDREMVLLSQGSPLSGSLAESLQLRIFREAFFAEDVPLPRSESEFAQCLDAGRSRLHEVADALSALVKRIFAQWRRIRLALHDIRSQALQPAVADIQAQLHHLLPADFVSSVPRPWLDHLPRYLQAISRRIERLPDNAQRDARLAAKVHPFDNELRKLSAESRGTVASAEQTQLRWMIEELRVSLFAQELKTALRVSEKRLEEQLQAARSAARH